MMARGTLPLTLHPQQGSTAAEKELAGWTRAGKNGVRGQIRAR